MLVIKVLGWLFVIGFVVMVANASYRNGWGDPFSQSATVKVHYQ